MARTFFSCKGSRFLLHVNVLLPATASFPSKDVRSSLYEASNASDNGSLPAAISVDHLDSPPVEDDTARINAANSMLFSNPFLVRLLLPTHIRLWALPLKPKDFWMKRALVTHHRSHVDFVKRHLRQHVWIGKTMVRSDESNYASSRPGDAPSRYLVSDFLPTAAANGIEVHAKSVTFLVRDSSESNESRKSVTSHDASFKVGSIPRCRLFGHICSCIVSAQVEEAI